MTEVANALYIFTRELLPGVCETEVIKLINLRTNTLGKPNETIENMCEATAKKIREDFSRLGSDRLGEWIMGIYESQHRSDFEAYRRKVYEMSID